MSGATGQTPPLRLMFSLTNNINC